MADYSHFLAQPTFPNINRYLDPDDGLLRGIARKHEQDESVAGAARAALNAARDAVEVICKEIEVFESKLQGTEEIGLYAVGGPSGATFFPQTLIAEGSDKVVFRGEDQDGKPFTLIQHVSQLNFAMRSVPVAPDVEPRRIGFHHPEVE